MVSHYLQNGQATLTTFWSTHWSDAEPGKDFFFFPPYHFWSFLRNPWDASRLMEERTLTCWCPSVGMPDPCHGASSQVLLTNSGYSQFQLWAQEGIIFPRQTGTGLQRESPSSAALSTAPCLAPPGHFRSVIPHFAEPEEIQLCPWSLQHSSPWQFVFLVFSHL